MASSLDPFICDTCDRQLTSLHSFNRHIQFVHSNHRPHQCPQCFNCFKTIDALRSHRRLVHTIAQLGPFQCELCDALFKRVSSIASHHRLVHMPSANIECADCTRIFRSDKHLQKHRQSMHSSNNVTVRCTKCPKIFKNQKNLRNHSHRMHRLLDDEWLKEVTCDRCEMTFRERIDLIQHQTKHSQLREHHCAICSRTCKSANTLGKHRRDVHSTTTESYKCAQCPTKQFRSQKSLSSHRFVVHSDRRYYCANCRRLFKSRMTLLAHHQKVHTAIEHHRCDDCNKQFATVESIRRHMLLSHSIGTTPSTLFRCTICPAVFNRADTCKRHAIVHSNDRIECNRCSQSFKYRFALRRHYIDAHPPDNELTMRRRFECDTCNKSFATAAIVHAHFAVHRHDRSLACPMCPKQFNRSDSFKRHVRTHEPNTRYECDRCVYSCNYRADMINHQQRQHHFE